MKNLVVILILFLVAVPAAAQDEPKTISSQTEEMDSNTGYFDFYWDESAGKIWLEIERFDEEFLYVNYLSHGLGSNDVGLDRGQIGGSYVVYFRWIGPKVLMMQKNYEYLATSDNPDEVALVDEAFAVSTLWGFEVSAEEGDRVLVDATDFLLRDARDAIGSLRRSKQGRFKLDASRSAIDLTRTKNFPQNTEFEAILTLTTDSAGSYVRQVAPTSSAVTIQQHHSFVQLPDDGFTPRRLDVRSGYFGLEYMDFSVPLSEPIRKRFISRHRLDRVDPEADSSEAVEPIIYYVDRGAPEPMRSALVEGASWWNQAYSAAGYINAFQVRLLPDTADPMDVRYNTIQWVHRASRGWSYGDAVIDPRTGEIIKGHITLGSLRARQDYLIAVGLLQPYGDAPDSVDRMQEMALARLRQLSAHETGHTLGLRHNFAASSLDRASVMDYPYPYVQMDSAGALDLSQAYTEGIGAWDKATIIYGYADFPDGVDEDSALAAHLDSVFGSGMRFVSDGDARPEGSAHPYAHLWDNGPHSAEELIRLLDIRARLLASFSERAIPEGTPLVMLEEALVPIYLFHRYQIEACAKWLGGVDYRFAIRGSGPQTVTPVPADEQWRAFKALLRCIEPSTLAIPDTLLRLMPPQTTGIPRSREIFKRRTGTTFDPYTAADNAADIPIRLILNYQRAARLVEQKARDSSYPGLAEIIDRLIAVSWKRERLGGHDAELRRVVDNLVLHHLIRLAANKSASNQVRAIARHQLQGLQIWCEKQITTVPDKSQMAHLERALAQIGRFLKDPAEFEYYAPLDPPAGSPIGSDGSPFGCSWE